MRRLFILTIISILTMGQVKQPALPDALVITRKDCADLVRHVPMGDVAYRPGVDVHGRPVVAADLTPRLDVPAQVDIDIIVRPFHRRGGRGGGTGYSGEGYVGRASVLSDGRAYYNGRPVHDEWQQALATACREALLGGR
jgi:hypothetical protein